MKLTVNNFRRIEKADIDITGVTLVCGHNANGKTTLAQAMAACLTKNSSIIESLTKKEAGNLVKDGAKDAKVYLIDGEKNISISFPKGDVLETGITPIASRLACGLDRFGRMDKKEAAKLIYRALHVSPSKEEFSSLLKESTAAAGHKLTDEAINDTWEALKVVGWENTQKDLQDAARDFKRDWQNITGVNWGAEKAKNWFPEGYDATLPTVTEEAHKVLEAAFEKAVANKAVSGEEKRILAEQAANYKELQAQYKVDKKHVEAAEVNLKDISQQIYDINAEIAASVSLTCPCCGAGVKLSGKELIASTTSISDERKAALQADLIKFMAGAADQETNLKNIREALADTLRKGQAAGDATRILGEIQEGGSDEAALETARAALHDARALQNKQIAVVKAAEINDKIFTYLHIAEELSETGIRKRRLDKILNEFNNGLLAEYSKRMGVNPVTLDINMRLWLAKRSYLESSSAEQYIMDVVLQFAISTLEDAPAVVIDGADIIQFRKGRESLIMAAKYYGKPVLITMSIATEELCPVLSKSGIGNTYWLDGGIAKELV